MSTRPTLVALLVAALGGCAILEDNGTRLGFALERASIDLRESNRDVMTFDYLPKGNAGADYEVHMLRSLRTDAPYGGYITVSGTDGGGTSYQGRYVYIPKPLHVAKHGMATQVTLRKVQGRIEVVGLE